jgi:hypothetical protein
MKPETLNYRTTQPSNYPTTRVFVWKILIKSTRITRTPSPNPITSPFLTDLKRLSVVESMGKSKKKICALCMLRGEAQKKLAELATLFTGCSYGMIVHWYNSTLQLFSLEHE